MTLTVASLLNSLVPQATCYPLVKTKKGSCRESNESHDKVKASEKKKKKDTESSLGLVKNRQTTKTFNKGKRSSGEKSARVTAFNYKKQKLSRSSGIG